MCVECKPTLLPRGKQFGWCAKHGVHECPLCHPEVAQLATPPRVTPADLERAQKALDFTERPENHEKCKLQQRRLQFASEDAAKKAGIEALPAWQGRMVEFVAANGEITYDQTRVARLSSRVPGSVWRVEKQVGDRVQRGEVLALIDAAEVGRAKAEFLHAFAQVDLKSRVWQGMQGAAAQGAIPSRTSQETEAALREARIRLLSAQQVLVNLGLPIQADELSALREDQLAGRVQFAGIPETLTRSLDPKTTTANLFPIKAPIDGILVTREAVAGEVVDTAKLLFVVADTHAMWLDLDVRIEDALVLATGQPVLFRPDGSKSEVGGKITWISTAIDQKTRTVKVRAELANEQGKLRASTFGHGRILLREEKNAVVVPKDAVQWEGCCHVVFVRDKDYLKPGAPKVFHVRKVVPGATDAENMEIIVGLLPGEFVATKGSGVLRSELLKNDLGDG
jgi:cobalt-zinc-cadmium efflux system membrane fusion protein